MMTTEPAATRASLAEQFRDASDANTAFVALTRPGAVMVSDKDFRRIKDYHRATRDSFAQSLFEHGGLTLDQIASLW